MSITKLNNLSVSALTALPSGLGGKVLQAVSTLVTTSQTTSSSSYVDVTSLSVSITPSSASNKILLMCNAHMGSDDPPTGGLGYFKFLRGSTNISLSTDSGTYEHGHAEIEVNSTDTNVGYTPLNFLFLDSPSTTSSVTYKAQMKTNGSGTIVFNRSGRSDTNVIDIRCATTLIALEIGV